MMSCPHCGGAGYRVSAGQDQSLAVRCDCQDPCPECEGEGFVSLKGDAGWESRPCSCGSLDARILAFNRAGLPVRYGECSFDSFRPTTDKQSQALELLRLAAGEFRPGAQGWLLWGEPGVGKTHLACAMVRHLTLERGHDARFVDFFQLLQQLKNAYGERQGEKALIQPLLRCDFLVIDEAGKGRNTEWELGVLDQLISYRYNNRKTVFLTSNYDPSPRARSGHAHSMSPRDVHRQLQAAENDLESRLGGRVMSRLAEICDRQHLDGGDFRRRLG